MDEYDRGMDPEVVRYFQKIIKSFLAGLLWLLGIGTAGFFFKLAIVKTTWQWYHVVYYIFSFVTLAGLIFFLYKIWRKR